MLSLAQRGVLIGGGLDFHVPAVHDQPRPSASKCFCRGFRKFFFEARITPKTFFDGLCEVAFWLAATPFFHHLPKQRMIVMAAALVSDRSADLFWNRVQV